MTRFLSLGGIFLSAALATATSATAQGASYYYAVPATKPAKAQLIARETVWTWRDDAYTARRGADRDTVQCELVARQAGKLASFSAGGIAFDTAALEKCNAKAK